MASKVAETSGVCVGATSLVSARLAFSLVAVVEAAFSDLADASAFAAAFASSSVFLLVDSDGTAIPALARASKGVSATSSLTSAARDELDRSTFGATGAPSA